MNLKKSLSHFYLRFILLYEFCTCLSVWVCAHESVQTRRRHCIACNWRYSQLHHPAWVLGTGPGSSARAPSTLTSESSLSSSKKGFLTKHCKLPLALSYLTCVLKMEERFPEESMLLKLCFLSVFQLPVLCLTQEIVTKPRFIQFLFLKCSCMNGIVLSCTYFS